MSENDGKSRSIENLKPFQNGNKGGPGRPKGLKNRSTYLRHILETKQKAMNPLKMKEENMPVEKILDLKLVSLAMNANTEDNVRLRAMQMIKETVYGKLPQDLNLGGQEENPIIVDEKVSSMSTLERLIVKYGIDSDQVTKYKEQYGKSE